jgi:hypothetical protein
MISLAVQEVLLPACRPEKRQAPLPTANAPFSLPLGPLSAIMELVEIHFRLPPGRRFQAIIGHTCEA